MRLRYCEVKNFRSIASLKIDFTYRCRILVGINESGKTNILKALALLDSSRKVEPDDLREFPPDEDHTEEAFVRFVFTHDKAECQQIADSLMASVLTATSIAPSIVSDGSRALSLAELCERRNEGLHQVDVRTGSRTYHYWGMPGSCSLTSGWYKPTKTCPQDLQVAKSDGQPGLLRNFDFVHESARVEATARHLEPLTMGDLESKFGAPLRDRVRENLPDCLFWSYSDTQLLPAQLNLDGFAANPQACEPLRQMFILAGVSGIQAAIAEAKKRSHGVRNLLAKVATHATKHLRKVWKDYRGVTIALEPNGPNVDASVRDAHNVFQFAKRSDGFKRFIAFLLLVSAKAQTSQLADTLYLQDEPDTSLHPSGARYLRDELIRIAESNYVVFSTHSIFMIDREQIGRHLIVEKKGEVTNVREVDASNITDEEVVYNAIGYSLFENLKYQNIVFEGYKDKLLFQTVIRSTSPKAAALKKSFSGVGVCHARGVKDISRITPLLELAGRQWIVVSDSDKVARDHQNSYEGAYPWLRYDELLPGSTAITGEDFLLPEAFRAATRTAEAEFNINQPFDIGQLTSNESRLAILRRWLHGSGLAPDRMKEAVDRIKDLVFADLRFSQISDQYLDLLGELARRLEGLKSAGT